MLSIKALVCLAALIAVAAKQHKVVKTPGRTTRYWDCCKPSCGWPGKGPANPVHSCANNGYTIVDVNQQSGCNGGPAFACNNQAPWVINDTLSYGFAAFSADPNTPCCHCYRLDFTSTAVAGKSMIVQVSNSGGDLGESQFDLQIPGGGVGLFNGCKPQWGAPDNGWGNQYGGVSNIEECNQLPVELQEGCRWRFTWFMGADNPNVEFYEVSCPQDIINRSGCYP